MGNTQTLDLSRLNAQVAELAQTALDLGWRPVQRPNGIIILFSPVVETFTLELPPVRQCNASRLRSMQRQLVRYSDPEAFKALANKRIQAKVREEREAAERREREQQRLDAHARAQQAAADPKAEAVLTEAILRNGQKIHVVNEHPWIVVRSGGEAKPRGDGTIEVYDSPRVIQRDWSDGRSDFVCPNCGKTSDKPRTIAAHFKVHGLDAGPPQYRFIPFEEYQKLSTPDSRPKPKAKAPKQISDPGPTPTPTPEPQVADPEAGSSDAEILDKIRELVLPGFVQLEDGLVEKLAEVRAELAESERLRLETVEQLNQARASFAATIAALTNPLPTS